jgi:hypothetical protein
MWNGRKKAQKAQMKGAEEVAFEEVRFPATYREPTHSARSFRES